MSNNYGCLKCGNEASFKGLCSRHYRQERILERLPKGFTEPRHAEMPAGPAEASTQQHNASK